jgi:hypothetical protein
MKYKLLFAIAVVALSSFSLRAQVNDTYVIPAVANADGGFGTRWATELHVFNPQPYPLVVALVFLPSGGAQGSEVLVEIQPDSTFRSENVLQSVFGRSGTGSMLVAVFPEDNPGVPDSRLARAVVTDSKTFNNAPTGTFGQSIRGTWVGLMDYEFDGISAIATGIRNQGNFRTNVGAVNLGRTSVTVQVSVFDRLGTRLANRLPFDLPPLGHIQDRLPTAVDHGSIEFFVDDPTEDALVFAYASVIDNRSGDPVYREPVLLASPGILFKAGLDQPVQIGRPITPEIARQVRQSAQPLGRIAIE